MRQPHSLGLPLEICQLQLFIKLYTAIVKCEYGGGGSEEGEQPDTRLCARLEAQCRIVSHSLSSRQLFVCVYVCVCAEFKHFVELHLRRQRLTALFGVLYKDIYGISCLYLLTAQRIPGAPVQNM